MFHLTIPCMNMLVVALICIIINYFASNFCYSNDNPVYDVSCTVYFVVFSLTRCKYVFNCVYSMILSYIIHDFIISGF